MEILVGYIHHRLRHNPFKAQDPDPNAQNGPNGWKWDEFLLNERSKTPKQSSDITSIGGHDLATMRKADMEKELQKRNIQYLSKSLKADLKGLLIKDELDKVNTSRPPKKLKDLFQRSNLERWGLNLPDKYLLPYDNERKYTAFELYTLAIYLSPYNPSYWTARAYLFHQQGHDDLALGDAYRALYLVDIVVDVHRRAKRPGLYPRIVDAAEQHIAIESRTNPSVKKLMIRDQGVPYFLLSVRKVCHHIIALSLRRLGAWRDATNMDVHILMRIRMPIYDRKAFRSRWKEGERNCFELRQQSQSHQRPQQWSERAGAIVPKPYPQARDDVDRTDKNFIQVLNQHYIQGWPGDDPVTATLRVEADADEKRLKVVANRSIRKGDILYAEEPNIRGQRRKLANPNKAQGLCDLDKLQPCRNPKGKPRQYFCENCKRMLSGEEVDSARAKFSKTFKSRIAAEDGGKMVDDLKDGCYCLFQDPLLPFCLEATGKKRTAPEAEEHDEDGLPAQKKQKTGAETLRTTRQSKKTVNTEAGDDNKDDPGEAVKARTAGKGLSCLELARVNYHYRACGVKWRWLHEAMQTIRVNRGKLKETVHNHEHGTALSLLLREVFDMTLMKRETAEEPDPRILAFEIDALYPIEHTAKQSSEDGVFPFSWAGNIVVPFDILECLGVDIFRELDFDTWVIQTVLRKLMNSALAWQKAGETKPWQIAKAMKDLYVHTAFTFFKRDDEEKAQNAVWMWDRDGSDGNQDNTARQYRPLNRIIVAATKDIDSGEEIVVNQKPLDVFGTNGGNEDSESNGDDEDELQGTQGAQGAQNAQRDRGSPMPEGMNEDDEDDYESYNWGGGDDENDEYNQVEEGEVQGEEDEPEVQFQKVVQKGKPQKGTSKGEAVVMD